MKIFKNVVVLSAYILVIGLVFGACGKKETVTSKLLMGGGTQAPTGMFPGAIFIDDCSATAVGRRHILTAGHCVVSEYTWEKSPGFNQGDTLKIYHGPTLKDATTYSLPIAQVFLDPSFARHVILKKSEMSLSKAEREAQPQSPSYSDLALIVLAQDLPRQIETVSIGEKTLFGEKPIVVNPGDPFVASGYGRENVCYKEPVPSDKKDKHETYIVEGDQRDGDDSYLEYRRLKFACAEVSLVEKHEFRHQESNMYAPELGLCPGDSGGGVYQLKLSERNPANNVPLDCVPKQQLMGVMVSIYDTLWVNNFVRLDDQPGRATWSCIKNLIKSPLPLKNIDYYHEFPVFCADRIYLKD